MDGTILCSASLGTKPFGYGKPNLTLVLQFTGEFQKLNYSKPFVNFSKIHSGHEYPIWCIDESSNGCYAVTGSRDTTARLWSYERKFPVRVYAGHSLDVDVSAGGIEIFGAFTDGYFTVHSLSSKWQLFCHWLSGHKHPNVVCYFRKTFKDIHRMSLTRKHD